MAWHGDFGLVRQLQFASDSHRLLALQAQGPVRLLAYDLHAQAPRDGWPAIGDLELDDFAVQPGGTRLAALAQGCIAIHDLATMQCHLRFRLDHLVQDAAVVWMGHLLGVLTDSGCASLYRVD